MSYETGEYESEGRSFFRRKFWQRTDEDRMPFIPYGLIPMLGLMALTLYSCTGLARGGIQDATERAAQQALIDVGADWATPDVSGQWVTLKGTPPSAAAARKAEEAVRAARQKTPFGLAKPVTSVRGDYTVDAPLAAPSTEPIGDGGPTPEWTYTLSSGVITLAGDIPNETARQALVREAERLISPPKITGSSSVQFVHQRLVAASMQM